MAVFFDPETKVGQKRFGRGRQTNVKEKDAETAGKSVAEARQFRTGQVVGSDARFFEVIKVVVAGEGNTADKAGLFLVFNERCETAVRCRVNVSGVVHNWLR